MIYDGMGKIMRITEWQPELGYLDTWLWLPRNRVAMETLKRSESR